MLNKCTPDCKKPHSKTLQDYEVISVIGSGNFGTCFKVRDKETGEIFAWKGMDYDELSESNKESLVSEINVLRQLQHPNIVQYYHHLVNHEAKSVFIVMECCEGGDLAQLIAKCRRKQKRFEEKYVWRVLFQICKALQVCHNKIEAGTILHRDIKPANIFLDIQGNAKLGDFGLARMLHRNESFAETFVGTPYYMSPEIVNGSKYDRKSDIWAVGCLIYEMCALQPPFEGHEFNQLSQNISGGKFHNIPDHYSADLQEIISFMLEVDSNERPNIEMVTRHPVLIRNIVSLGNEFPRLVANHSYISNDDQTDTGNKSFFSPSPNLSSTLITPLSDCRRERTNVSDVFTPDLRKELFYSNKNGSFVKSLRHSNPDLYTSILHEKSEQSRRIHQPQTKPTETSPGLLTQNIFEEALQNRLHAIRARECLLMEKEESLRIREHKLNEREKRIHDLEKSIQKKLDDMENHPKTSNIEVVPKQTTCFNHQSTLVLPEFSNPHTNRLPPPIPPRYQVNHDDSYCTIEPNDTLQMPTIAKLNKAALPNLKSFASRRVTFKSPKKFIKYDIENVPPPTATETTTLSRANAKLANNMHASVSSKGSAESSDSNNIRRKSFLSIFGLQRGHKEKESGKVINQAVKSSDTPELKKHENVTNSQEVLDKRDTSELASMWTAENKRAAFDLLAAMNAAEREADPTEKCAPTQRLKMRQSVRERNSLHRNKMRRSLMMQPPPVMVEAQGCRIII